MLMVFYNIVVCKLWAHFVNMITTVSLQFKFQTVAVEDNNKIVLYRSMHDKSIIFLDKI